MLQTLAVLGLECNWRYFLKSSSFVKGVIQKTTGASVRVKHQFCDYRVLSLAKRGDLQKSCIGFGLCSISRMFLVEPDFDSNSQWTRKKTWNKKKNNWESTILQGPHQNIGNEKGFGNGMLFRLLDEVYQYYLVMLHSTWWNFHMKRKCRLDHGGPQFISRQRISKGMNLPIVVYMSRVAIWYSAISLCRGA